MRRALAHVVNFSLAPAAAQQPATDRIQQREHKLDEATRRIELAERGAAGSPEGKASAFRPEPGVSPTEAITTGDGERHVDDPAADFAERILGAEFGRDERERAFAARPEVFIQVRYTAFPVEGTEPEFELLGVRANSSRATSHPRCSTSSPSFAPAFQPGASSSGVYVFAGYGVSAAATVYARYDQFNGDPVTGRNVLAFNFGYMPRWREGRA